MFLDIKPMNRTQYRASAITILIMGGFFYSVIEFVLKFAGEYVIGRIKWI